MNTMVRGMGDWVRTGTREGATVAADGRGRGRMS